MKFSLKQDKALVLEVRNKKNLQTELIAVKGDYQINLFFSGDFPLEGIHRQPMDAEYTLRLTAGELFGTLQENKQLKEEVKKLRKYLQRFRDQAIME